MTKWIYSEKMKSWDIVTLIVYLVISTYVLFLSSDSDRGKMIVGYSIGTQLFLYLLNYRSLRNFYVWTIWFIISLIHIGYFLFFTGEIELTTNSSDPTIQLLWTAPLLMLFQWLRYINLTYNKRELVAPNYTYHDLWDNRKILTLDYVLFVIYIAVFFVLTMLGALV